MNMNKTTDNYLKFYIDEQAAKQAAKTYNHTLNTKEYRNYKHLRVVVEGPENNFAVMDIKSAIASGFTYSWEV